MKMIYVIIEGYAWITRTIRSYSDNVSKNIWQNDYNEILNSYISDYLMTNLTIQREFEIYSMVQWTTNKANAGEDRNVRF